MASEAAVALADFAADAELVLVVTVEFLVVTVDYAAEHLVVASEAVVAQADFAADAELVLVDSVEDQFLTAIQRFTAAAARLALLVRSQRTLTRTTRLGLLATSWIQTHQPSVTKSRPMI